MEKCKTTILNLGISIPTSDSPTPQEDRPSHPYKEYQEELPVLRCPTHIHVVWRVKNKANVLFMYIFSHLSMFMRLCILLITVKFSPLTQGCCRSSSRYLSIFSMQFSFDSTFTLRSFSTSDTSVASKFLAPQPDTMPTRPACLLEGNAERQTGLILAENIKLAFSFKIAKS